MDPAMSAEIDPLYAEARRVLLDALEALKPHLDAVIVVGAQAVYLRTGPIDISVAPFTTDGDLALDPARLDGEPHLADVMGAAGFRLEPEERPEPGIWITTRVIGGKDVDLPVDLIVPSDLASKAGRRGARLGPHGKVAARKIPGLEAAIQDNDVLKIEGIADNDGRVVSAKVAGPTALLIAKAHKIQERLQNAARPDRVVDKDAGDVLRLMQTNDPENSARVAARLMRDPQVGESSRLGIEFLVEQFRASGSAGTLMAINYYRGALPPNRVQAICTAFTARLAEGTIE
ncbi:MAG TPA: hypothetical protein VG929_12330 [Actinomycetota bacterium]|nr:hypothetical protein [Actinomycetota bacterium]